LKAKRNLVLVGLFFLVSILIISSGFSGVRSEGAAQATTNSGLSALASAYAQVNRAENLGASKTLISSWSSQLNESAFLLEQAALPSNINSAQTLVSRSISVSNGVLTNATREANFDYMLRIVILVVAYGLVIPSSYGLAIITNKLYESYTSREERKFATRAIRKKRE
jgi:hypothetical protein